MAVVFPPFPVLQELEFEGLFFDRRALADEINSLNKIFVVDEASEAYFARVQRQIDSNRNKHFRLIHVAHGPKGAFDRDGGFSLLKGVLQLGADPDALNRWGETLSYFCSTCCGGVGWKKDAAILSLCRPDLALVPPDCKEESQLAIAMLSVADHAKEVAEIWRKVETDGFPSLAQLAHDQEWYAVHNLCRRRVISDEEKDERYIGKTAVEWARFHKQDQVAAEIMYLLEGVTGKNKDVKLAGAEAGASDVDELKEMLLLSVTRSQEQNEEIREELAALKAENAALKTAFSQLTDDVKSMKMELLKEKTEADERDSLRTEVKVLREMLACTCRRSSTNN